MKIRLKLNNKAHNILCGLKIGHISNLKITGGASLNDGISVNHDLQYENSQKFVQMIATTGLKSKHSFKAMPTFWTEI